MLGILRYLLEIIYVLTKNDSSSFINHNPRYKFFGIRNEVNFIAFRFGK